MEELWNRWEYVLERVLYDFNEDAFCGKGSIRKNPCNERPYVALETGKLFLCTFPIQGNVLVLIAFHGHFRREYLNLDYAANNFEHQQLIGFDKFSLTRAERNCMTSEDRSQYLEWALKYFHKKYWSILST